MFNKNKIKILGVTLLSTSIILCGMVYPVSSVTEGKSAVTDLPPLISFNVATGSAVSGSSIIPEDKVPLNRKPTLAEIYKNVKVKKVSYRMYASKKLVIKKFPVKKSRTIGKVEKYSAVKIKGKIKGKLGKKYVLVKFGKKGKKGYALKKKLSTSNPDFLWEWNGPKLTRSKGVNAGPSGKETYYNLPMGGVINIMRSHGFNDKYWVRSDGVKCYGKYVMIAADQRIRPLGSHVKTSLGMGIVTDTGTFIYSNPTQIDIAVAW